MSRFSFVRQCFSAFGCLAVCGLLVAAVPDPVVKLPQGLLQGKWAINSSSEFLAIPFAAPPVGQLRWKSPQPPLAWNGTRMAHDWGAPCIQNPMSDVSTPSEDCLFLNVFVPPGVFSSTAPKPSRPVLMFIHGGSYISGASSVPIYDGSFTAGRHDAIVVTVNYRLGVLGFGASELLRAHNSADNSTGNYGIQDQRYAMKWIRDNIHLFGGDSSRLMVFGESAGAGSTSTHLVMPRSSGLFAAAAMESGPEVSWAAQTLSLAEQNFETYFSPSCPDGGILCLLGLHAADLLSMQNVALSKGVAYRATIDGVELEEHPVNLAMAGKFSNKVPVLLGSNKDEGTMFNRMNATTFTWSQFNHTVQSVFTDFAEEIIAAYPPAKYTSPWDAYSHVIGDSTFTCPTRRTARWTTAAGMPTFAYFFTRLPNKPLPHCIGVCHSSELVFVFDFPYFLSGAAETSLAGYMNDYWVAFAAHHAPSSPASGVAWEQYSVSGDNVLDLDVGSALRMVSGVKAEDCDLFDRYRAAHPLPNTVAHPFY